MSMLDIGIALDTQLNAMAPALATAWENSEYDPVTGTPYQRVYLLPASSENPTFGDTQTRESGIFQITLCYPELKGSAATLARAELIRAQFTRGLTLTSGGVTVRISNTPSIAPARYETGLYIIDVSVPYFAYT